MVLARLALATFLCAIAPKVLSGTQAEEKLSASVVASLSKQLADKAAAKVMIDDPTEAQRWLSEMAGRLPTGKPQVESSREFLTTIHYEASRAGLDPQLVLAVVQYESAFRKYAVSTAGARGYMQIMPFWVKLIGEPDAHNLFNLRTNLRYGCVILRHYLDRENGDVARALARYNGSLGRTEYSDGVLNLMRRRWSYGNSLIIESRGS